MNINRKMPYTRPGVSVRHIEVEGALLVGSKGMRVFDQADVQIDAQEVVNHNDDDYFKFSWE